LECKCFWDNFQIRNRASNAIKGFLDFYGIDDPALPGIGEFSNSELQELYNTLIQSGSTSLTDALKVGATIEEAGYYRP